MKLPEPDRHSTRAADGTEIRYYAYGQGLPVLLANGLGPSWQVWQRQVAQLGDRYRFITWDYRGLFRNAPVPGPASIAQHVGDALAVLRAEGVERGAIIGWSLGVQVALELYRSAPQQVASLILINGAARARWDRAGAGLRRAYPPVLRTARKLPRVLESLVSPWVASPEAFAWGRRLGLFGADLSQDEFSSVARSFGRVDMNAYLAALQAMTEHDSSDVLPEVDVPTLVIAGDRDPFISRRDMEEVVQGIKGAEYLVLPGATHYVLLDHSEHVNLRIAKFFSERGYTTPA